MKSKKKYYAVAGGRTPGIYFYWFGDEGAEVQVRGFAKARYKGFSKLEDAQEWLKQQACNQTPSQSKTKRSKPVAAPKAESPHLSTEAGQIIIYTDGGCINNPGPGGYGVVRLQGKQRREFSDGFRLTTNNRMELMACIVGLKVVKPKRPVVVCSDSKYVVNGVTKGWARRWRANNWRRNKTDFAENVDLWAQLLDLCEQHRVEFVWVKGHEGNKENECCDRLANAAALQKGLPPDTAYESGCTQAPLS